MQSTLNDCASCGNTACHKNWPQQPLADALSCFILDDKWAEYDHYLQTIARAGDHYIIPTIRSRRYGWSTPPSCHLHTAFWAALQRALVQRISHQNPFELQLQLNRKLARALVHRIPLASTHLVVSQSLLPFVWESGACGGRTLDVLMQGLPLTGLHQRLDAAARIHPQSQGLNDYRAPRDVLALEEAALLYAHRIITPHREVATLFANKALTLDWIAPTSQPPQKGRRIIFPASGLARKGAFEVRQLALDTGANIRVLGGAVDHAAVWSGISTEVIQGDPLAEAGLVLLPAFVENQPRLLLRALSAGIPVITTAAAGLGPHPLLTVVPMGDYETLRHAFRTLAQELGLLA